MEALVQGKLGLLCVLACCTGHTSSHGQPPVLCHRLHAQAPGTISQQTDCARRGRLPSINGTWRPSHHHCSTSQRAQRQPRPDKGLGGRASWRTGQTQPPSCQRWRRSGRTAWARAWPTSTSAPSPPSSTTWCTSTPSASPRDMPSSSGGQPGCRGLQAHLTSCMRLAACCRAAQAAELRLLLMAAAWHPWSLRVSRLARLLGAAEQVRAAVLSLPEPATPPVSCPPARNTCSPHHQACDKQHWLLHACPAHGAVPLLPASSAPCEATLGLAGSKATASSGCPTSRLAQAASLCSCTRGRP